jgi:hypothetical protein
METIKESNSLFGSILRKDPNYNKIKEKENSCNDTDDGFEIINKDDREDYNKKLNIYEKELEKTLRFNHNVKEAVQSLYPTLEQQVIPYTTSIINMDNDKEQSARLLHEIVDLKERYYVISNQLYDSQLLLQEMNSKFDNLQQSMTVNNNILKSQFQRSYLCDVRDYAIRSSIPIICTALINTPVAMGYGIKTAAFSYFGSYIFYKILGV